MALFMIAVPVVFTCSLALSAVIHAVYKIIGNSILRIREYE